MAIPKSIASRILAGVHAATITQGSAQSLQSYRKQRYFWEDRSHGGLWRGIEYFARQASHPEFACAAHAGIAACCHHLELYEGLPPPVFLPWAMASAQAAIDANPFVAEGHTALAMVIAQRDWQWRSAEALLQRAIESNPSYPPARLAYGELLTAIGRHAEALDQFEIARDLDPFSAVANTAIGLALYYARQYSDAAVQLRRTIQLDSEYDLAHLWLARTHLALGMPRLAIQEFQRARLLGGAHSLIGLELGCARAADGARGLALRHVAHLGQQASSRPLHYFIAAIYAALEWSEPAIVHLAKSVDERSRYSMFLCVDPLFDGLHNLTGFHRIVSRLHHLI